MTFAKVKKNEGTECHHTHICMKWCIVFVLCCGIVFSTHNSEQVYHILVLCTRVCCLLEKKSALHFALIKLIPSHLPPKFAMVTAQPASAAI